MLMPQFDPTVATIATVSGVPITMYGDWRTMDQEHLKRMADLGDKRVNRYALFEAYYKGRHNVTLTERQTALLDSAGLGFADNFCDSVVDAKAQRMTVETFDVKGPLDTRADAFKDNLERIWKASRMTAGSKVAHVQTLMKGDGFIGAEWDDTLGSARLRFQRPDNCKPIYADDDPDRMDAFVKRWKENAIAVTNPNGRAVLRMNIYYPDRIEKYYAPVNEGERWYPHIDLGDATWPLPWMDGAGEPIGIPYVHLRNKAVGCDWGQSELDKVVPMQDLLNKWMLDLDLVMDEQGWAQRWATGVTTNDAMQVGHGILLEAANADAKFGQFDAADPVGLLKSIEAALQHISGSTSTPMHLLMMRGEVPSGEALKSAEAGLVAAVEDRLPEYGDGWEDALRIAQRITNAHPDAPTEHQFADHAEYDVDTVWDGVATRDEPRELGYVEGLVRLGLSRETGLTMLGIKDAEEEIAKSDGEADVRADRRAREFNAGGLGIE